MSFVNWLMTVHSFVLESLNIIEGVLLGRQRKCNTIEEFAPPRKILEPNTTTIRGPFSFSSLPGKVDQRKDRLVANKGNWFRGIMVWPFAL